MAIPKYNELFIPIMNILHEKKVEKGVKGLVKPLAEQYNLTEEDINEKFASGNGFIFENRIAWALSYLSMSNLIDKPERGIYHLSKKGIELLKTPDNIQSYIKKNAIKTVASNNNESKVNTPETETPQEELYNSFASIKASIYEDIISAILSKTPKAFEELVVLLLQKMGYGGKVKDSGLITKYTNDGGIDGIIKEDILGFGRIHIQAKRYDERNTIQRDEIQKFVGALAVAQSNKGVFITTSSFSKGAIQYAANLSNTTNIVLIDGQKLAEYIYDFNLGMQTEQIIEIKKIDTDFWDSII